MAASQRPHTVGFLGVGTMNAAIVRGLCRADADQNRDDSIADLVQFPLLLGPPSTARPESTQAALLAEFGPKKIELLETNSAVLQRGDVVFLGVRPPQVEGLLEKIGTELHAAQTTSGSTSAVSLVNLVSTLKNDQLHRLLTSNLTSAAVKIQGIAKCVPLPAVQHCKGTTACTAYEGTAAPEDEREHIRKDSYALKDVCLKLFGHLGVAVSCEEANFPIFQAITGMMGPLYQHCSWLSEFMQTSTPGQDAATPEGCGIIGGAVDAQSAQTYVTSVLQTFLADAVQGNKSLKHLMKEQTPGGLNEQAIRELSGQKEATMGVLRGLKRRIEETK